MDRMVLRHYSCGVVRRFLLFAIVMFSVAPLLTAESVTILFDASFSMSLRHESGTRMETLSQKLYEWIDGQPTTTRYALLVAEHQDSVDLRLPYPAHGTQVKSEIAGTIPWGAIDLGRTIQNAARIAVSIASANGETRSRLVIVTDAEDMAALMPERTIRLPAGLRYEVLRLDTTGPASVAAFVDGLQSMPDTELASLGVSSTHQPPGPRAEPRPDPQPERVPAAAPNRVAVGASEAPSGLVAAWARVAQWAFLAATVLGSVAVVKAAARHRRRVNAVLQFNARPPTIPVEVRGPSGRARGEISRFPAGLNQSDLNLVHADLQGTDNSVRFTCIEGKIHLTAEDKVKINGIGRTEHEITDRDQIRIGAIRVVIGEIQRVKPRRLPRTTHRFYAMAPAAAAAVAVLGFALAPPQPRVDAATVAGLHESSSLRGSVLSTLPTTPPAPTGAPAPSTGGARPEISAGSLSSSNHLVPELRLPMVIGPDDPLPDFDLDYLAIHAHPDDEALDFGAAIARMHAAGLRGAVVLLTDGNAGLDQYPWRDVGPDYPAYDLSDAALASVRIAESREAIGWLGAQYYIRLGLPNHPYGSIEETLSPREVFGRWGGRERVAERIAALIRAFRPEVVLSPDGPAQALEHFEHEATGLAVAEAVATVADEPESPVRVHLVAVDPLQAELYESPYRISAWQPSPDASIPRLRQLFALRAHRTQRDATVIGVETRLALENEFYLAHALDPSFDIRQLFPEATTLR